MGKQMQFELWQECNSGCKFCYNLFSNKCTKDELKISALDKAYEKISDLSNYPEYDTLSYLGGEFFQGQLKNPIVKEKFMKLMEKTAWLYSNGYIKHVWVYATLTIGDQEDLYEMLKLFDKKDDFWILTSYDTIGRFHTQKMEDTWDYHMRHIHELYPEIHFNITTILTGDVCDRYLDGRLSFKEMEEKYHTTFFFKQCGAPGIHGEMSKQKMNEVLPNFFPTRSKFLKFLRKFKENESVQMWDKLFNIQYRADDLYRNFNDSESQMQLTRRSKTSIHESDNPDDMHYLKCGHMDAYGAYIDSEGCVMCDKLMISQMMDGSSK